MLPLELSKIYKKLADTFQLYGGSDSGIENLQAEAREINLELMADLERFNEYGSKLEELSITASREEIESVLVHLRVCSMNMSSIFDNLAEHLAEVIRQDGI